MTFNRSSVFLEVIEGLSKSPHIHQGNDLEIAKKILYSGSQFLKLQRVNAWLMNNEENKLISLCAYDKVRDEYYTEGDLSSELFPVYFRHIQRNDIIISVEAQKEIFNRELVDLYLKPLDIQSMMEVPILSAGKMKGIICFENTGDTREWSSDEQHFAVALTQLLTLTLETKEKNNYRDQLEQLVNEKSTLISEINHRVKNNLAIMTALIRGEMNKAKDDYHRDLFENVLSKSFSLATLQSTVYQSKNYDQVNFGDFLQTLISNMNHTYGSDKNVVVQTNFEEVNIDISKAIPCSLIVNEILTNSFKYAFEKSSDNQLNIKLGKSEQKSCAIEIRDNGQGLPADYYEHGTGFELIESLTDQIDGKIEIDSDKKGTLIKLEF
jgi:two-component sensor histidine kinase